MKKRGEDPLAMIQKAAGEIASTGHLVLCLSVSTGLATVAAIWPQTTSPLYWDAYKSADAWREIDAVASRCGATSLSLKEAYVNAHNLRNSAAHDPGRQYPAF